MTFIAGAYTVGIRKRVNGLLEGNIASPTYVSIGQVEDGITIDYTHAFEPIRGDNLGDSIQDGVYRGGDCFMDLTCLEWNLALISNALWPGADDSNTSDATFANLGKLEEGFVGKLISNMGFCVLLTKVAGPNATPAYVYAAKAILAPGYPVRFALAPRLRRLPLRFQLFPYQRGGSPNPYYWFEGATAAAPAEISDD